MACGLYLNFFLNKGKINIALNVLFPSSVLTQVAEMLSREGVTAHYLASLLELKSAIF